MINEKVPLVLIVDDDRTMRSLLNLAMSEEGYQVAEAENGEQCLSEYAHFQPDLILMDAVMPDVDGFTCCEKIRSLPGGDHLPILMITVLNDEESVEQAFKAGATDYITKPIHWSVLSGRVRRLLNSSKASVKLTSVQEQLQQHQAWAKLSGKILQHLVLGQRSEAIELILSSIRNQVQATRVLLYRSDSQLYLESGATWGENPNFEPADFNLDLNLIVPDGEQYQQGQPIFIDVSQADLPFTSRQQLQQLDTKGLSIIPLKQGTQFLGWLIIHFSRIWDSDQLFDNRLLDLANFLTIAIDMNFASKDNW
ncbi:MAG: response regulator [Cyanobacteria bacterium P01_C01_bin.72]